MSEELVRALRNYGATIGDDATAFQEGPSFILRFRKDSVPLQACIRHVPPKTWAITLSVSLPNVGVKRFFIESKWVWFPEKSGCHRFSFAPLDSRYKLHCSDDAFFKSMLANQDIVHSLMSFPEKDADHVKVSLKDATLLTAWTFTTSGRFIDLPSRDRVLMDRSRILVQHGLDYYFEIQMYLMIAGKVHRFSA